MKNRVFVAVAFTAFLFSFSSLDTATWKMDKNHAKLGFSITHLMVSDVDGLFRSFDATIVTSKEDFSDASVEMTADVKSIDTDNDQRDTHLKSPDFFDAEKYPVISFKSKSFEKVKDNTYKVKGDLTMHGVTKEVALDAVTRLGKNPQNNQVIAGFKITGMVKRSDFGVGKMPEAMLGDEVTIVANAEFSKK